MTDKQAAAARPSLPQPIRLLVALAGLSAIRHPASPPSAETRTWYDETARKWLASVCKLLELDTNRLPPTIDSEAVTASAQAQSEEWSEEDKSRIAALLVEASVAAAAQGAKKEDAQLSYTPLARAFVYATVQSLGLSPGILVPPAEKELSATLFSALKAASENEAQVKVEQSRKAHSQGWGGTLGRHLATGAGVIAGGVLIGVTGGLAAPAIAALLAPLGVGGILAGGAAPVVLGTLFGVGGGGLAGRRVRERWKGVEEFSFVEVGAGTKATKEEIQDLQEARRRLRVKTEERAEEERKDEEKGKEQGEEQDGEIRVKENDQTGEREEVGKVTQAEAAKAVDINRAELEERLLNLSLAAGTRSSISATSLPGATKDAERPSLDTATEEDEVGDQKKPPSLTATIVVPGLLTVSKTEAITAWRSICSSDAPVGGTFTPGYETRARRSDAGAAGRSATDGNAATSESSDKVVSEKSKATERVLGLKDGRDVYLLRYESERMLNTGRDIDLWVESKLKGKIKAEIIKRTVLNAYFAAVKLPLTVYTMASMSLDNTWMQAQDRARKAGRILGEVLEKRVQGERPETLIGSSLGAYTVMEALLYLASLRETGARGPVPAYVEAAYFISLPSAPTPEEWAKCRSVVSRRLVNAWSSSDFVLAGVCRLHEVVSRAATLSSGVNPAGLGPVNQPGVQNIDVSAILRGHMELQAKMGEILRVIDVDA